MPGPISFSVKAVSIWLPWPSVALTTTVPVFPCCRNICEGVGLSFSTPLRKVPVGSPEQDTKSPRDTATPEQSINRFILRTSFQRQDKIVSVIQIRDLDEGSTI